MVGSRPLTPDERAKQALEKKEMLAEDWAIWRRMIDNRETYRDVAGEDEPESEADHFYRCKYCGQPVDMRRLYEVLHHEQPVHDPLPIEK